MRNTLLLASIFALMLIAGCSSGAGVTGPASTPASEVLLQGSADAPTGVAPSGEVLQAATVYGIAHKTSVLGTAPDWRDVPEFVKGLKVQQLPLNREQGGIDYQLRVESTGLILVAAAQFAPSNPEQAFDAWRIRMRNASLGWMAIGELTADESGQPRKFTIFRKVVEPGDKLYFDTEFSRSPQLILLENSHVAKIAALTPMKDERPVVPSPAESDPVTAIPGASPADQILLTSHLPSEPYLMAPPLQRELIRQALWLAANEDLGLKTRDDLLGETFTEEPGGKLPLDVVVRKISNLKKQELVASVCQTINGKREILWERAIPLLDAANLPGFATTCEKLSREQFAPLLKRQGWKAQALARSNGLALPPALEAQLLQFNPVAQFGLLRSLHRLRQSQGESPELLWALARTYANLAILTAELESPSCRVYQARALLYAERAWNKSDDSGSRHMQRAYVRAVTGLHAAALHDLRSAVELQAQGKSVAHKPPAWVHSIRAFCEFKHAELEVDAQGPELLELICVLQLMSTSCSTSDPGTLLAAQRLHATHPESLIANNVLGSLAAADRAESDPLQDVALAVAKGIADMPDAPDGAREYCKEVLKNFDAQQVQGLLSVNGKLCQIVNAADRADGERIAPAWSALRSLIQDFTFHAALQLVIRAQDKSSAEVDQRIDELQPLVEGHPYAACLQLFRSDKKTAQAAALRWSSEMKPERLGRAIPDLISRLERLAPNSVEASNLVQYQRANHDSIYGDLVKRLILDRSSTRNLPAILTKMAEVSPHAPELAK